MRLVKSLAVSAGMLLVLASGASAQTNIVDNGDFATGTFANWSTFNQFPGSVDWTAVNNDARLISSNPGGATVNTLSQSFTGAEATAGLYRLTFSVLNTLSSAGTMSINVFGVTVYSGITLAAGNYLFNINPVSLPSSLDIAVTPATNSTGFISFDNFVLAHPIPEVNATSAVAPVGLMIGACLLAYDRRRKTAVVGC